MAHLAFQLSEVEVLYSKRRQWHAPLIAPWRLTRGMLPEPIVASRKKAGTCAAKQLHALQFSYHDCLGTARAGVADMTAVLASA